MSNFKTIDEIEKNMEFLQKKLSNCMEFSINDMGKVETIGEAIRQEEEGDYIGANELWKAMVYSYRKGEEDQYSFMINLSLLINQLKSVVKKNVPPKS